MGVRQPAEVIRDLAVGPRPDDEVPVIRQDTVRQDPQGMPAMGLDGDPAESLELLVRAKQAHPAHGAVEDVVGVASGCSAG